MTKDGSKTLPMAAPLKAMTEEMMRVVSLPTNVRMIKPAIMTANDASVVRCRPRVETMRTALLPKTAKHTRGKVVKMPPMVAEKPKSARSTESSTPRLDGAVRRLSARIKMAPKMKIRGARRLSINASSRAAA